MRTRAHIDLKLDAIDALYGVIIEGGKGSGHFNHKGIPGHQGGSADDDTRPAPSLQGKSLRSDKLINTALSTGLPKDWRSAGYPEMAKVKAEIASSLSETTGIPEDKVNDSLYQWAQTANFDDAAGWDLRSVAIQEAASREFDIPLSDFQKEGIKIAEGKLQKQIDIQLERGFSPENTIDNDRGREAILSSEENTALVRAIYENTQGYLEDQGISGDTMITLYRGISVPEGVSFIDGQELDYIGNALESWSAGASVARIFTGPTFLDVGHSGYILSTQVRARDIFSTSRTGFGSLREGEVIIFGGHASTVRVYNPKR